MTTGTMHMGGYAAGAARVGSACSPLLVDPGTVHAGTVAPIGLKPWHATNVEQVSPVFCTDRPTRRLSERFP